MKILPLIFTSINLQRITVTVPGAILSSTAEGGYKPVYGPGNRLKITP